MLDNKTIITNILQNLWPRNKAKGLLAQTVFLGNINDGFFGPEIKEKIIPSCWLLAPKEIDFFKFRFSFFVHSKVLKSGKDIGKIKDVFGERYRPFHAISEFMSNAGIGVVYAIPFTNSGVLPLESIKNGVFEKIYWRLYNFQNGIFVERKPDDFFSRWPGDRGRMGHGTEWDPVVKDKITKLDEKTLTELLLNELFYSGLLKSMLKKPLNDPYDVDSFLISLSQQNIFPMEIKEKFPGISGDDRFFGIDAGRVMMLLRICLPNDSNAIYLIRELDKEGNFIGWKYITLTDIIMTASWNLQAGGAGMGGQSTQTIRLPYKYFKSFDSKGVCEDNLKKIGNMPKDIKNLAKTFSFELESRFNK